MLDSIEKPVSTSSDNDDDDLEHYYCECDPNVALCGVDVTDSLDHTAIETPLSDDCIVCIDLIDFVCPKCGT